jgi:mannose-6-phosphate isomerase-like protein (cupin superfamily)
MDVVSVPAHKGEFFKVIHETRQSQTAVMTIAPGADAGPEEEHAGDQILYVLEGEARVRLGGREVTAKPGALVTIPARTPHHVRSVGRDPLFVLTIYAPPAY